MLSILDWLKDKVNEALERVSEVRRYISDRIVYVLFIANGLVRSAIDYATRIVQDVREYISSFIRNISHRVEWVYTTLRDYIVSQVQYALRWAEEKVINLRNSVYNLIDNTYRRAVSFVNGVVGSVRGYFEAKISDAYRFVNQRFGDIFHFIGIASCIINFLRTDPIGFLIALFELFLLPWLQEEIAYQFGSVKTTLPARQNFFKRICN